jgi:uncharacterized coiled-coil DUF342 family protein
MQETVQTTQPAAAPVAEPQPRRHEDQSPVAALRAEIAALNQQVETLTRERSELNRKIDTIVAERDYLRQVHTAVLEFAQKLVS